MDLKAIDIKPPSKKTLLTEIQKLFPAKGIFISKIIVTRGESQLSLIHISEPTRPY